MQHSTCVMHVPWYMPWLLNSGFLRCRWRGKHSRQSRRMRNLQLYVSGKRPIEQVGWIIPSLSQSLSCMQRVQVDARCKYIIAFSRIYSRRNSYMYIWVYVCMYKYELTSRLWYSSTVISQSESRKFWLSNTRFITLFHWREGPDNVFAVSYTLQCQTITNTKFSFYWLQFFSKTNKF